VSGVTRHDDEWDPARLPDLAGRRYLVTGSNAGLGYFASEQLVRAGARVVMTGRNPNRLAGARAAVERRVRVDARAPRRHPLGAVETLLLDTSNLGSVRAAAATARTGGRIDGVLLNAGTVHPPKRREETVDGHEVVFATNALGHYALCGEVLTALAATRGRMVWVGSMSTMISRTTRSTLSSRTTIRRGARTCSPRSRRRHWASRRTAGCGSRGFRCGA
jgi:NAD(P)-dependent dehydrogenase (short-subunit alcohol dehydrogenase family)